MRRSARTASAAYAAAAFRGMLIEQKQQALLISGESGAGKTEAVKACLRYIVQRSSEAAKAQGGGEGGAAARAKYVEDCIMQVLHIHTHTHTHTHTRAREVRRGLHHAGTF